MAHRRPIAAEDLSGGNGAKGGPASPFDDLGRALDAYQVTDDRPLAGAAAQLYATETKRQMSKRGKSPRIPLDQEALDQAAVECAEQAGFSASQSYLERVYDIACEYDTARRMDPGEAARARKGLQDIAKDIRGVKAAFADLPLSVHPRLREQMRQADRLHWTRDWSEMGNILEALEAFAEVHELTAQGIPTLGGARRKDARDALSESLALLYEEETGWPFRFPDKRKGYRGPDFVRSMAIAIDPALKDDLPDSVLNRVGRWMRLRRKMHERRR